MSEPIVIALLMALTALFSAVLTAVGAAWMGSKKAKNEEIQLGLDALKAGLTAANDLTGEITKRLEIAKGEIIRIERQAYRVLSENNHFRTIHGVDAALSLEAFEPIAPEKWEVFIDRLDAMKSGATQ